ncbi:MAG: AraC family transcriptional regulator [Clostridiales bacterium]|nr:AraC family transcriptional regulator [Clostridiales bacterium]
MYDSADLNAFRTLVGSCCPVWHWVVGPDFQVLESDCPAPDAFLHLLTGNGREAVITRHWEKGGKPLILTIQPLLNWLIAFEAAGGALHAIHAVGPFFSVVNESKNHAKILQDPSLTEADRAVVGQWIGELPGVAPAVAVSWAQMLHYCLAGEKITSKDVGGYLSESPTRQPRTHLTVDPFDKQTGNWEFEQELLEKIRKGDLSVMDTIARANAHTPKAMPQETIEDYRQMEHLLLTLVSRAAVDGGMPQKSAFALCTEYREKLNASETYGEMVIFTNQMLEDYARQVHRAQQMATCSARIRLVCEYISNHPEEKLTLELLAQKAGYTQTYLSRRFRQEMGMSIVDYIRQIRLERAQYWLTYTDKTIEEISDALGFGNRSYFSKSFRDATGVTPTDYRKQHQKV